MSTPQLFLPHYAYTTSRSYAPSTQVSDYGGVAEAARIYPQRSVTKTQDIVTIKAVGIIQTGGEN